MDRQQTGDLHGENGRFKVRVKEMRIMPARELLDHEDNWHIHPDFQRDALEGSLEEIGVADVLQAYYSERNGGRLTLVDGHLSKSIDPDQEWPVLILDLNDDEADTLLALGDNIGKWGEINPLRVQHLIDQARQKNLLTRPKAQEAAARLLEQIRPQVEVARRALEGKVAKPESQFGNYHKEPTVKVTVAVADRLMVIERALKATGLKNRGSALNEICQFYLKHHEAEGKAGKKKGRAAEAEEE